MGMFDTLYINTDKLPVSDEEKIFIGDNPNWQTKDLDCDLTEVYITDDGKLKINRCEYEIVPQEKRPYPNDKGVKGLIGSLERKNERVEEIPYNGTINFYSSIGDKWYQFYAEFNSGILESIKGGKS